MSNATIQDYWSDGTDLYDDDIGDSLTIHCTDIEMDLIDSLDVSTATTTAATSTAATTTAAATTRTAATDVDMNDDAVVPTMSTSTSSHDRRLPNIRNLLMEYTNDVDGGNERKVDFYLRNERLSRMDKILGYKLCVYLVDIQFVDNILCEIAIAGPNMHTLYHRSYEVTSHRNPSTYRHNMNYVGRSQRAVQPRIGTIVYNDQAFFENLYPGSVFVLRGKNKVVYMRNLLYRLKNHNNMILTFPERFENNGNMCSNHSVAGHCAASNVKQMTEYYKMYRHLFVNE